jgi:glycosyltransferase involved in cell wall biosynthesis
VGGGPEESRLRARAAELPQVTFLGPVSRDRALAAIASAAFVVVPSLAPEVFGMSTLEALASARPAVVPRGSAMAELVDPGRTGLHFEAGDAASLAAACRGLAGDPQAVAMLGEEARRDYEDHFAPEVVLAALERLYRSLGS